jgi:hypothetical protein
MSTLKTYLTAVDADADSAAAVYWDKVESFLDSEAATDVETTDISYSSATAQNATTILLLSAASGDGIAAGSAIAAKRAYIVDASAGGTLGLGLTGGSGLIHFGATATGASAAASITVNANNTFTLAAFQDAANVARMAAYGLTITSAAVANSANTVSLVEYFSATGSQTASGERYVTGDTAITAASATGDTYTAVGSATNFGFGIDDTVKLTVGGNSVTVSPNTGGATTLAAIADDVTAAWATKYGSAGTASGSAVATVTSSAGIISIVMLDKGTAGNNVAISFEVGTGTVTATNAKNLDYVVGVSAGTSDNTSVASDVLVTFTHNGTGSDPTSTISWTYSSSTAANLPVELTTTRRTYTTVATAEYDLAQESADPIAAEGANAGTPDTTAAVSFSRVGWLG